MRKLYAILILVALATALRAQNAVSTLAGQAQVSGGVDGSGTNALFNNPAAMVMGGVGNYYVADSGNHAIRKVFTNGIVATYAGKLGVSGYLDATGTNAYFNTPSGLAIDASGNIYVSDTGNNVIREITLSGAVSTIAGVAGSGGFLDANTGTALFNSPLGIVVTTNGTLYVADTGNHCIRAITAGNVTTFAGNPQVWGSLDATGTNAMFNSPCGLKLDAYGNLFVSDANNDTIRKITPAGVVTTFAGIAGQDGTTDGTAGTARFRSPAELAFDANGNLFVADSFNQTVREISTNGVVSTVCGTPGVSGANDGTNGVARMFNPYGLVVAKNGSLVVADAYNELVRVVVVPFTMSLQLANGAHSATLTWASVIGRKYQVQYKSNLTAANWSDLGAAMTATGYSLSATDNSATGTKLYRVLLLP